MTVLFYIFLSTTLLFLGSTIWCLYLLNRAGEVINHYESFYESVAKGIESHYSHITNLIHNNVILQGDDSVKALHHSVKAVQHLLSGYYEAGKNLVTRKS